MSKRRIGRAMGGLFGLPIGPAAVCDLEPRTAEALATIHVKSREHGGNPTTDINETRWPQKREGGRLRAAVARGLGVFQVAAGRGRDAFSELMGRSPPRVVTGDRYLAYAHLPAERRQACRAHLRSDFRAMMDRGDAGSTIAEEWLMRCVLFERPGRRSAGDGLP